MKLNSLARSEKLKGKKIVGEIFGPAKKSVAVTPLRAFYHTETTAAEPSAKFGVTVPKKIFKRAVNRNLIKRLMREAIRLNKHDLLSTIQTLGININIMLIFHGKTIPTQSELTEKIIALLQRLENKLNDEETKK